MAKFQWNYNNGFDWSTEDLKTLATKLQPYLNTTGGGTINQTEFDTLLANTSQIPGGAFFTTMANTFAQMAGSFNSTLAPFYDNIATGITQTFSNGATPSVSTIPLIWANMFRNSLSTTASNVSINGLQTLPVQNYTLVNIPNTFNYLLANNEITISTPGSYIFIASFWSTTDSQRTSIQLDSSNRANLFFNNNYGSSNSQGFTCNANLSSAVVVISNITVLNNGASFNITNNSSNNLTFGGFTLVKL